MSENIFVLSLGGSLIVPKEIDVKFLRDFQNLILKHIERGKKFVIITGGGCTARMYINAAKGIRELEKADYHEIGLHATRLNAEFLRVLFKEHAHPEILINPTEKKEFEHVLFGAGWKPGFTTDYDAVLAAKTFGVKRVANLSNIDYVYDKDPKKYKDAKPIKEMSWKELLNITGTDIYAGINIPFDPLASQEAMKAGLEVVIMNGRDIQNLDNYLSGRGFKGTVIR
ncbi:MAG: UMP kinase [Spirochaetes bacterium]|nr:MAG: UMP kinase [Spirochaetota bacterium]